MKTPGFKFCRGCRETLPIDRFQRFPSGQQRSRCGPCHSRRTSELGAKNAEKQRARNLSYYKRVSADRLRRTRSSRDVRRKMRAYHLLHNYGVTELQFRARLASQGGVCAVCGSHSPGKNQPDWALDHDHMTGAFRGVLCHPCNSVLGHAYDKVRILAAAIRYLRRSAVARKGPQISVLVS